MTDAPASRPASASRSTPDQAESRRRVEAGPEGHARVERDDHLVGDGAMPPPGRPDDDPPAEPQDREVALPGVGPVVLVDLARLQLADGAQPEGLEVAKVGLDLRDVGGGRAVIGHRQVGAHDGRAAGIDAGSQPLVDELERGLDAHAAGRDPREDLRDRLDRLLSALTDSSSQVSLS